MRLKSSFIKCLHVLRYKAYSNVLFLMPVFQVETGTRFAMHMRIGFENVRCRFCPLVGQICLCFEYLLICSSEFAPDIGHALQLSLSPDADEVQTQHCSQVLTLPLGPSKYIRIETVQKILCPIKHDSR